MLIIDDNCDAAELLAALISFEGFKVRTARDGADGIRQTKELRPDVVLLDIGLPGMDGYEVARRLRSEPCFRGGRIIATGWGGPSDVQRSRAAGFDHHLVKPVRSEEVIRLIRDDVAAGVTTKQECS